MVIRRIYPALYVLEQMWEEEEEGEGGRGTGSDESQVPCCINQGVVCTYSMYTLSLLRAGIISMYQVWYVKRCICTVQYSTYSYLQVD